MESQYPDPDRNSGTSQATGITKRSVRSQSSHAGLLVEEKGGVQKFLMNFDQFNTLQEDLYNSTVAGSYLSIITFTILFFLIIMETWTFLSVTTDNIVSMDSNADNLIQINFDIVMHDIPCDAIELTVLDAFGWEKIDTKESSFIQYHSIDHRGESKGHFYTNEEIEVLEKQDKKEDLPPAKLLALEEDWASSDDAFKHQSFNEAVGFHEFTFVLFYADWCSHCRDFHSTWNSLKEMIDIKGKKFIGDTGEQEEVKILKINCVDYPQVCTKEQIRAFPTLLLYSKSIIQKKRRPINYDGRRNMKSLLEFLTKNVKKLDHVRAHHHHIFSSGCQTIGHLEVPRVPGEFRFQLSSARSKIELNPAFVNVSHTVNHLSFGEAAGSDASRRLLVRLGKLMEKGEVAREGDKNVVKNLVLYEYEKKCPTEIFKNLNPLDSRSFYTTKFHEAPNHHLKVVTTLVDEGRLQAYQITHSSSIVKVSGEIAPEDEEEHETHLGHFSDRPRLAQARFLYDLSPMSVRVTRVERRWYDFATNILGLLGGFYTIAKLSGRAILNISS